MKIFNNTFLDFFFIKCFDFFFIFFKFFGKFLTIKIGNWNSKMIFKILYENHIFLQLKFLTINLEFLEFFCHNFF